MSIAAAATAVAVVAKSTIGTEALCKCYQISYFEFQSICCNNSFSDLAVETCNGVVVMLLVCCAVIGLVFSHISLTTAIYTSANTFSLKYTLLKESHNLFVSQLLKDHH